MSFKGLRKVKVLKTEADVLEHSYGKTAEEAAKLASKKAKKVAGKAAAAPPPPPPPPPPPAPPAPSDDAEKAEETKEEYAARIEKENLKDDLIEMAEERDLDTSGNKDDLAARIADYDYDDSEE